MTWIMFNLSERCIENRFCNWLSCSIIPSCVSTSVWARILVIVASVPPSINDLHCFCDTIELDQQQIWWEVGEHFTSFFVKLTSEIRDESFINAIIVKLSFKLRRMTMTIRINIGHVPLSMAHYVRVYCSVFSLMALFTRQQGLDEDEGCYSAVSPVSRPGV